MHIGPREASREPFPCSPKWDDWCLTSPRLPVGGVSGRVSPKLSVRDVGKSARGNVILSLSLEIRIGCSVRGVVNTGRSLTISPELSVRGVLEVTMGAGLTLELAVRV